MDGEWMMQEGMARRDGDRVRLVGRPITLSFLGHCSTTLGQTVLLLERGIAGILQI